MKPAATEDAGLRYAARVIGSLPGVTSAPDALAERLALWLPFAQTLILELGTVVCFGVRFGHRRADAPARGAREQR